MFIKYYFNTKEKCLMNTHYATRTLITRQKRQQKVRQNIIALIISVFLIIVISIVFASFSTEANDMEHQPSYKYYKSIEIVKGDTLWSIANDNIDYEHYKNIYEYINEVKRMNSLTSDRIAAGNYIIVPYYSSDFVSDQFR